MRNLFLCASFLYIMLGTLVCEEVQITPKEKLLLEEFRRAIESKLTQPYMNKDSYLIGWLRVRKHSVEEATKMISKSLIWRRENRMDTTLDEREPWDSMRNSLPYYTDGRAYDGTPVLEFSFGKWDTRKYMLAGKRIVYNQYQARMHEEAANISRILESTNPKVHGYYLLVDLSGFNIRKQACLSCIPATIQFVMDFEGNYPQAGQLIRGVNTPRLFDTLWSIVLPFFSEHDQKTIRLLGVDRSEWRADFLQQIPKDQLLPEYGGTKKRKSF